MFTFFSKNIFKNSFRLFNCSLALYSFNYLHTHLYSYQTENKLKNEQNELSHFNENDINTNSNE